MWRDWLLGTADDFDAEACDCAWAAINGCDFFDAWCDATFAYFMGGEPWGFRSSDLQETA